MTMGTKQEIFREKLEAYLGASKEEKGRILDVVTEVTEGNRKAAIRRFRTLQTRGARVADRRGRKITYGKAVTAALNELWEIGNRVCAERLHPLLGEYVRVLKRDGMWTHDKETTELLY